MCADNAQSQAHAAPAAVEVETVTALEMQRLVLAGDKDAARDAAAVL
ncbi:hypothetical protein SAMN05216551_109119 [Chitinasiproducens palmae]|uniref:Uncharacterized protein n=1 Tax=Chitinasiproducens palmae TaxID=1770053 RepID=A0A1H2PT03_9BURK|nr:hypothetical protein SAMN05216551_109119 [Chitinasiproducens palmae]